MSPCYGVDTAPAMLHETITFHAHAITSAVCAAYLSLTHASACLRASARSWVSADLKDLAAVTLFDRLYVALGCSRSLEISGRVRRLAAISAHNSYDKGVLGNFREVFLASFPSADYDWLELR